LQRYREEAMVEEAEVLDDAHGSFVAPILEDGPDNGLECRGHHLWCLVMRSIVYEDDFVDSEFVATMCKYVVT
jgi:hypothetical protein